MGSKVKCPSCGAKNDQSSRRCRLCTDLINPDAPDADAPEEVEAPQTADFFDSNEIKRQVAPARDRFGRGPTGLGARIAAVQGQAAPTAAPTAAPASAPASGSEPGWRADDLGPAPTAPLSAPPIETGAPAPWPAPASPFDDPTASGGAIAFENRPAAPTAPPIEYEAEPFDPDALFRDRG